MQLIFETETTVNIAEKMTSVETMPIAESNPDSPSEVMKVSKCNSIEINNTEVDTAKTDENGFSREMNGDNNDTITTESPENCDKVVSKDKKDDICAQNSNGDIETTAEIDTIDPVSNEDTIHPQTVPDPDNLMQVEENPPEIPENLEMTNNPVEKKSDIEESALNSVANYAIQQECVLEHGDKTHNENIENISLQHEIQNENTDVKIEEPKIEKGDSVTTNGDNSETKLDNPISTGDTTEGQLDDKELTESNQEEETKTAVCIEETPALINTVDEKTKTSDGIEMDLDATQLTIENDVPTADNALEENTKATDEIHDINMELNDHEENRKVSNIINDNEIKQTNSEQGLKSTDETGVNGSEVTYNNKEIKAINESPENNIETTVNVVENKAETEVSKTEATSDMIIKNTDETQENKMEMTDFEEETTSTNDTQEDKIEVTDLVYETKFEDNKTDSANSKGKIKSTVKGLENNVEVTDQEERATPVDEIGENKTDVTHKQIESTDQAQENKIELSNQFKSSEEKDTSKSLHCEQKIFDANNDNSENCNNLGSNACNESIINCSEKENNDKELIENCVEKSTQIKINDNIIVGNNVKLETEQENINMCGSIKKEDSEVKDICVNKVDSPKIVKEKEVKISASELMDVDATEDLKSDKPADSDDTETKTDTLFDKLMSEEIVSINSGKTDNLDSDRKSSPVTVIDCDEDTSDGKTNNILQKPENKQAEQKKTEPAKPKKTNSICGLSNTLDILSDDDDCIEECKDKLPEKSEPTANENKCINLDEDDDVMLIDDSPNEKDVKEPKITDYMKAHESESVNQKKEDDKHKTDQINTINLDNDSEPEISKASTNDDICKDIVADVPIDEDLTIKAPEIGEKLEKPVSPKPVQRPLIPENFLKAFRKNVLEMNKDELEEFCLMKIVEGIMDQANLGEIKTKLKSMSSHVEEWKKKCMALTKQNRDLQIVLKTVQDEQKKRSEHQVVPLKITRSVGMQVYMAEVTDKNAAKRKAPPTTPAVRNNRNAPRSSGKPNSVLTPIPVPRLVPAPNNSPIKGRLPQQVQNATVTSNSPKQYIQNGMKTPSPVQKTEKRPFSSVQSVTVDLTDDEPPAKQPAPARNNAPQAPVRLVAQQQLMKPRSQAGIGNAAARKVFIPINPQNNIRPGQTITLKSVPPNARIRGPSSNQVPIRVQSNAVRGPRPNSNLRHPAPLPEVAKQQQPPNWKALPPAPDLKISKVENGIVISWKIEGYQEDSYEEIASYQLYAYQETSSPPSTLLWKKIGDVKALPLPMACTLTQFMAGYKYYFAVRAVDIRSRIGTFSLPGSILLLNK